MAPKTTPVVLPRRSAVWKSVLIFLWTLILSPIIVGAAGAIGQAVGKGLTSRMSKPLLDAWSAALAWELGLPRPAQLGLAVLVVALLSLLIWQSIRTFLPAQRYSYLTPVDIYRPSPFVGRTIELDKVKEGLRAKGTGAFAIWGPAGMGKSALAAEAVWQLLERERALFPGGAAVILCEGLIGKEGTETLWERIASKLGLEEIADPTDRLKAIRDHLDKRPHTLLVLDNVEPNLTYVPHGRGANEAVSALYRPGHTKILLTARVLYSIDELKGNASQQVTLAEMDLHTRRELFVAELRKFDDKRPGKDEWDALDDILDRVGGEPLDIVDIASYSGRTRRSLPTVRDDLKRYKSGTPSLSLTYYEALSPSQRRLFAGLSLMARANFPRECALAVAVAALIPVENEVPDPQVSVPTELDTLVTLSLIQEVADGKEYRLHRQKRAFGADRFSGLPEPVQVRLLSAAIEYWLQYAYGQGNDKQRRWWKQKKPDQRRAFISANLRSFDERRSIKARLLDERKADFERD